MGQAESTEYSSSGIDGNNDNTSLSTDGTSTSTVPVPVPIDVDYSNVPTLGYRVLDVHSEGPASHVGLVSFFDFLVGCNGRILFHSGEEEEDKTNGELKNGEEGGGGDVDFVSLVKEHVGRPLELLVFNVKAQESRLCYVTPSDNWWSNNDGGNGLLGVTIRVDSYGEPCEEQTLRVLSVEPGSPAEIAGLFPQKDFLLGTQTCCFSSDEVLEKVLVYHRDRLLELYVYNSDTDAVRRVRLCPTTSWGEGDGLLGAEVGRGYLHRLPQSCRLTLGVNEEDLERAKDPAKSLGDAVVEVPNEEPSSSSTPTPLMEKVPQSSTPPPPPVGDASTTKTETSRIMSPPPPPPPTPNPSFTASVSTAAVSAASVTAALPPPPLSSTSTTLTQEHKERLSMRKEDSLSAGRSSSLFSFFPPPPFFGRTATPMEAAAPNEENMDETASASNSSMTTVTVDSERK